MTKNEFYEKNDKNKMKKEFIPQRGDYQNLKVYQLGNCIYALTYAFAHRHLEKGDGVGHAARWLLHQSRCDAK